MKKVLYTLLLALLSTLVSHSQDLNWNTVSYSTGSTSANFGSIGSPASTVSLNISVVTSTTTSIDPGSPHTYMADPTGTADDCSVPCALRTSANFDALSDAVVYTFTFSPTVTGLSFRLYDIDGTDAGPGDQATVTASNGANPQNITMTTSLGATITGSGTNSAMARGVQGNTTDDFVEVSIISGITTLTITYQVNQNNSATGQRSFSIGNMSWSGVLPVKWVYFSGKPQSNGNVDLKWTAEESPNSDYYTIERSKNGQTYTSIGQVPVLNGGRNTYTFTDPNPGNSNSFYRIRQTDKTGHYDFSNIVLIKQGINSNLPFTIFPNPANDHIIVNIADNVQLGKVQIYDIKGRLLYQSQNGRNRIETGYLKTGMYSLRIADASGKIYRTSFLKQ